MTYTAGDVVLSKLHQGDRRNDRTLEVVSVSVTGRVVTKNRSGRRLTFKPHQVVLVKKGKV